jgi:hypothetical protein
VAKSKRSGLTRIVACAHFNKASILARPAESFYQVAMTPAWAKWLSSAAEPPSEAQQEKARRAEAAVRAAVKASRTLSAHDVITFTQGSYRNRTNVPRDSDVDICVFCDETFFFELPPATSAESLGIVTPGPYAYADFKTDVGAALAAYFPAQTVSRGTKAFNIRENTYRIDADVIPCFGYRYYPTPDERIDGTAFVPDGAQGFVHNFPQQNYDNGVSKNEATKKRFKSVVRALKALRYAMDDAGVAAAREVPSYFIECLVWNVGDESFLVDELEGAIASIVTEGLRLLGPGFVYQNWREVNGIKYLFHGAQPWRQQHAVNFLVAVKNYVNI